MTGAYGVVCAAKSQTTGDSIAIKKVQYTHTALVFSQTGQACTTLTPARHPLGTGHQSIPEEDPHEARLARVEVRPV